MTNTCPRLIEVALPIKEISAEAVRDKSLRHGHLTTLHMWFAWRPLAASRAVIFSSLVPDPDDDRCPKEFKKKVEELLKTKVPSELTWYRSGKTNLKDPDPYKPYDGVPDTLRNRLLMFIAKWSPASLAFQVGKTDKAPKSEFLLDDRSLVKWETGDPENYQGRAILKAAHELIRVAHGNNMPTVLDPFSGRGSIPLEGSRLGCNSIANDYSPVAYLILKAGCEYPQRFGCSINIREESEKLQRKKPSKLADDFDRWANIMLEKARTNLSRYYPKGSDGKNVLAYLWVRTIPCSNPSCQAKIPVIRSPFICNKPNKKLALKLQVDKIKKQFSLTIVTGKEAESALGTKQERGPVTCPICDQRTSEEALRQCGQNGQIGEQIAAVIVEGSSDKEYRIPEQSDFEAFEAIKNVEVSAPTEPIEEGQWNIKTWLYGMKTWGSLFNHRQGVMLESFIATLRELHAEMEKEIPDAEYRKALALYLGILISRIAQRASNVGIWNTKGETIEHPFGRQAIPMTWDYPEGNPFSSATGGVKGAVDWIKRIIIREGGQGAPCRILHGDAAALQLAQGTIDVVVTDPPYFDAIAYADLSDYFYVWFKRSLGDIFPELFATPLTPKGEEATALRHRHNGSEEHAENHFKNKLAMSLAEARRVMKPDGVIAIMFAHQSTKAWSALISAVLQAGLTIDGTWAIDTELTTALKASMSTLSSSVTVACKPRVANDIGSYKTIKKEIAEAVQVAVQRFWTYGLRGADLIVACYGPAVSVFGKYERVEKADGSQVEVPELLDLARQAARDAIAGEFQGDSLSSLYYVWANLYGATEQSWDDARLVVQMGSDAESATEIARRHGIFVLDGSNCRLALLADREGTKTLGKNTDAAIIDCLHQALSLWKAEKRTELVSYLVEHELLDRAPFWKLAQALFEVLPHNTQDWKLINALLSEKPTLISQASNAVQVANPQMSLNIGG